MVKEGIYRFALSCTKSKKEAARCIGLTPRDFRNRMKKYDIQKDLLKESEKNT
jgi:transcriptional regulator with GAF, ATPase, and Fis domain